MKNIFLLILLFTVFGCKNKSVQKNEEKNDSNDQNSVEVSKAEPESVATFNWIDDFKEFRQAVYTKNKTKLKTYFNFPVGDKSWGSLVSFNAEESKSRAAKYANPDLFYEEDFDQYFDRIFDADFVKSVMKIKTKDLYEEKLAQTPEFKGDDFNFTMIANYDDDDEPIFQLNLSYTNNAVDENGEQVSEGEHNVIYIFHVINGKKLVFKSKVFAG
ncbi:MAG: hypothetical protein EOO86_05885 [Pedobacter sp.]|nr:MAG: hypothetical protein EOO86_05885 [Pedobacter sp.]